MTVSNWRIFNRSRRAQYASFYGQGSNHMRDSSFAPGRDWWPLVRIVTVLVAVGILTLPIWSK